MRERAVSTALSYVLTLGISTLLVAGLLTAGVSFVDSQQTAAVDAELRIVGQRLAADLATADQLGQFERGATDLRVTSRLPNTAAGAAYTIGITADNGNVSLSLSPTGSERRVTVDVANTTAISPGSVSGGDLVIRFDDAAERLDVSHA